MINNCEKMQVKLNEKEKKIAHKIIGLIKQKIPMNKESPTGVNNGRDSDDSGSSTSGSRYKYTLSISLY